MLLISDVSVVFSTDIRLSQRMLIKLLMCTGENTLCTG